MVSNKSILLKPAFFNTELSIDIAFGTNVLMLRLGYKNNILSLDENTHNDENISRFLLLSKLSQELKEDSP